MNLSEEKYYIQRYARLALAQMTPEAEFAPPEQYLLHTDAEGFTEGFTCFRQILRGIYERLIEKPGLLDLTPINPESGKMQTCETDGDKTQTGAAGGDKAQSGEMGNSKAESGEAEGGSALNNKEQKGGRAKKKAELKAKTAFRLPINILKAVSHGLWHGGEILVGYEKAFGNRNAMDMLRDAGFSFTGISPAEKPRDGDIIHVGFPACPELLNVLNAFYGANDDQFILCDWRYIVYGKDAYAYGLNDALRAAQNTDHREILQAVDANLTNKGFTRKVLSSGFFAWTVKYFYKKDRKETAVIHIECDGSFAVNIRPLNAAEYSHRFGELNENVRGLCLNGPDCRHCGYCTNEYYFEYEGKEYVKCQIICANFSLRGLKKDDINSVLLLLDWETDRLNAAKRKARRKTI